MPVAMPATSIIVRLTLLVILPVSLHAAIPLPRGYYINCGSDKETTIEGIKWIQDLGFINVGNTTGLKDTALLPLLSNLRYFPDKSSRKYCYVIPVAKGAKYLIRSTYYYGNFDGGDEPPVFDQIIDGTFWNSVNTSENFAKGLASYYETVIASSGKTISFCLARNEQTVSSPFISALELANLEDSMYNSTDFTKYMLSTIARHRFGIKSEIMSYPDDPFNRYWQPFTDANPIVESHSNVTSTDFWNLPPEKAFSNGLTTSRGKQLTIQWPPVVLPSTSYYIALYFQDNRTPSPYSWRVFDVLVNGKKYFPDLNVTSSGVMVYGSQWPLAGQTQITMTPHLESPVGPVINAAEALQIVPLGGRTHTRDVIAMEEISRSFDNPPADWRGDPCLPKQHSWTGITCSDGEHVRVVKLNLTNYGLSGSLPVCIANLTAVTEIWLGGNKLTGAIPEMGSLKSLVTLHLEDNRLTGKIPSSLGSLDNLKEIFLQNNNLKDEIPDALKNRNGINIKIANEDNSH